MIRFLLNGRLSNSCLFEVGMLQLCIPEKEYGLCMKPGDSHYQNSEGILLFDREGVCRGICFLRDL